MFPDLFADIRSGLDGQERGEMGISGRGGRSSVGGRGGILGGKKDGEWLVVFGLYSEGGEIGGEGRFDSVFLDKGSGKWVAFCLWENWFDGFRYHGDSHASTMSRF